MHRAGIPNEDVLIKIKQGIQVPNPMGDGAITYGESGMKDVANGPVSEFHAPYLANVIVPADR